MTTSSVSQKDMKIERPDQGFIFWPVGSGDSTTISVHKDTVIQIDLRHLSAADDEDDPRMAVIDDLEKMLPEVDGKPYLAVFILTHPDEDHCRGFADLLKRVKIGELWHTPRVFREYHGDLCDDAKAFRKEAKRRAAKMIEENGAVVTGDRVHIIGYDTLLEEDDYKGFPRDYLTIPGNTITELDGKEMGDSFRAFVHGPFKDDCDGERNDTSLALQVTLVKGEDEAQAMLLGDLCYPGMKKVFDRSKEVDLAWNIFLAPHHCSKSVMYWKGEGEEEECLKQDILDAIEKVALSPGYVVASSRPVPSSNQAGDNPPHTKAKARYEEIVPDTFLCTQEHPNEETPEPIIFALEEGGLVCKAPKQDTGKNSKSITDAVAAARGGTRVPTDRVGFGNQ
jgi:beta-lactamase superfamily II metal-dependent hydrolase